MTDKAGRDILHLGSDRATAQQARYRSGFRCRPSQCGHLRKCQKMTTPDDDDPWTQPPEWVPLPDLPRWLEWRFKLPGSAPELIPVIIGGIRRFDLIYRVQDIPEDFRKSAYTYTLERRLPPGFGHADDPSRIIVKDWDLVVRRETGEE